MFGRLLSIMRDWQRKVSDPNAFQSLRHPQIAGVPQTTQNLSHDTVNNHFAFRHYYLMLPSTPEVLVPVRRHWRVDRGVTDVLVPESMLQTAGCRDRHWPA